MLAHPELPSCNDCQKWLYDPKTWQRMARGGKELPRPPDQPPPCSVCPKIPQGAVPIPDNAVELSRENHLAYTLALEVMAGRPMPDDPITWRNCALVQQALQSHDRGTQHANVKFLGLVGTALVAGAVKKGKP